MYECIDSSILVNRSENKSVSNTIHGFDLYKFIKPQQVEQDFLNYKAGERNELEVVLTFGRGIT